MGKRLGRVLVFAVLLAGIVAGSACNKSRTDNGGGQGSGPPAGMFGGPGRPHGPIGEAMMKLFKGPQSLKDTIGRELNSESPPWETIQPQAKEFAQLASSLSKYDPPKGSKESWTKLTGSLSDSAAALDRAAQAKSKDDALAAHAALSAAKSCSACHQAHRAGPGDKGPPG
jgi:mono/diheme cytochrome c family protein